MLSPWVTGTFSRDSARYRSSTGGVCSKGSYDYLLCNWRVNLCNRNSIAYGDSRVASNYSVDPDHAASFIGWIKWQTFHYCSSLTTLEFYDVAGARVERVYRVIIKTCNTASYVSGISFQNFKADCCLPIKS